VTQTLPLRVRIWLTDRPGWIESCYPSYGDWFVHEKWIMQKMSSAKSFTDPSVWKERTLSQRENLITVHYSSYDEDYDNVGVWTWDAHDKRTPNRTRYSSGSRRLWGDSAFDRGDYGEKGDSDNIGVPRDGGRLEPQKTGDDKFWNPDMGRDKVYPRWRREPPWGAPPGHQSARDQRVHRCAGSDRHWDVNGG